LATPMRHLQFQLVAKFRTELIARQVDHALAAFAFTEDGKVVDDLQDPSGGYPETTGVTETPGRLYIQNLHLHSIGWLAR